MVTTSPLLGGRSPQITLARVVFPAPLSPTKAIDVLLGMFRLMFLRTGLSSKITSASFTEILLMDFISSVCEISSYFLNSESIFSTDSKLTDVSTKPDQLFCIVTKWAKDL